MTYAADCRSELGGIEWLDDPARSARRTRASLFLFRTFSRQDQDRTVAMAPIRTQGVDQAKAVHARHVDVSNDHVGRIDLQPTKGGDAILPLGPIVAMRWEERRVGEGGGSKGR